MAFFATSHGKLSSNENKLTSNCNKSSFNSTTQFALAIAGIKYLYIIKKDFAKNFQDCAHEERYARCKTIPGTRSHHSFIPISETVLEKKRLSSDVVGNQFSFGFEKHAPCCFQIVPIQNDAQFQPGHYIARNYDQQW